MTVLESFPCRDERERVKVAWIESFDIFLLDANTAGMRLVPRVEEALVVLVYSAHVVLVPGTKVEESFTLHAVRDVVVRGHGATALDKVRSTVLYNSH